MRQNQLQIEHLDRKLARFGSAADLIVPDRGWIHAIRTSIRMSLEQLGSRLGVSKQAVKSLEDREASRSVTLKTLSEVAEALDMQLVYGFVPRGGSVKAMIESRALEIARAVVERTSASMSLEDQQVAPDRLDSAIRERADEIAAELPRFLWN